MAFTKQSLHARHWGTFQGLGKKRRNNPCIRPHVQICMNKQDHYREGIHIYSVNPSSRRSSVQKQGLQAPVWTCGWMQADNTCSPTAKCMTHTIRKGRSKDLALERSQGPHTLNIMTQHALDMFLSRIVQPCWHSQYQFGTADRKISPAIPASCASASWIMHLFQEQASHDSMGQRLMHVSEGHHT